PANTSLYTLSLHDALPIYLVQGKQVSNAIGHAGPVTGLVFTKDGEQLITASTDKILRVWKVGYRVPGARFEHGAAVACIALSKEDRKSTRLNSSHLGISYA